MNICINCGFVCDEDFKECPRCGGKFLISSKNEDKK